jgi:hypothetical protein
MRVQCSSSSSSSSSKQQQQAAAASSSSSSSKQQQQQLAPFASPRSLSAAFPHVQCHAADIDPRPDR